MSNAIIDDILEKIVNMSLIDVASLVKKLEDRLGVSANSYAVATSVVAGGSGGDAVKVVDEKKEFSVVVKSVDLSSGKVNATKAIRKVCPALNLKDAMGFLGEEEPFPKKLPLEPLPRDKAEDVKKELEAAGMKVELE